MDTDTIGGTYRPDRMHETYRRLAESPITDDLSAYRRRLTTIKAVELKAASDCDLHNMTSALRGRALNGEPLDALLPEVFALTYEACARTLAMRPFDEQLMTGIALHNGNLVQMQTGEGKTLAAVFPVSLNALTGRGVHVFTANDYLARRDAEWMAPVYRFIGLTVGCIQQGMPVEERRKAYASDITYVTAKEAGFDFLRDQIALDIGGQVHRAFHFTIIDEADFILIDEARVPLVIAGRSDELDIDHRRIARLIRDLQVDEDYQINENSRIVTLNSHGILHVEHILGIDSLHEPQHQLTLGRSMWLCMPRFC